LNDSKNKRPVSIARVASYPENVDYSPEPLFSFWWIIVIGCNIPTLLTGLTSLLPVFGKGLTYYIIALVICGPLVVTPVWNIRIVLARRRAPETKIKWRKTLIVCNLYIALWGILLLVSRPGHWAGLSGTMAVASLEGLRQARHTSKKTPKGGSKGSE
jgi:hypothetical protein